MSQETNQRKQLVLWGIGTGRTMRPLWAMHEMGLDFQLRPILPRNGDTQSEEYTALTARQKVPLLQDQDLVLTESVAIVTYLSDAYGKDHNRLVPTSIVERAKCLEWCVFALSELDGTTMYVLRRHVELPAIYGEAPQAVIAAKEYFVKQMRSVDRALADGRTNILGDRFGAADILLITCLTYALRHNIVISDAARAYITRQTARQAYKAAEQRNTPNKPPADVAKV